MPRCCFLLLGACLLSPGFLTAQAPARVKGVVKQLDAEVGTVTVRRKGAMEDELFNLFKKDLPVMLPGGEKGRLDAVKPGQAAQLIIGASGDVEAVEIDAPVLTVTVVEVDTERRRITIQADGIPAQTMAVAAEAKVWLAKRAALLREVKRGSEMTLTTSLDGKTALDLKLVADPDGKPATKIYPRIKKSRLPGLRFEGVVTDIDGVKNELRLTGPKTKGVPKTMPVARDAVVQVIYSQVPLQDVTLKQVARPAQATVLVSAENQQVTRVLVQPPVIRARVKALEADGGQLVVEVDGQPQRFALRRDIKIMDKARVRRLPDLQPNLAVSLVLSLDREQLLAVDIH
jgi:hypothetical protein